MLYVCRMQGAHRRVINVLPTTRNTNTQYDRIGHGSGGIAASRAPTLSPHDDYVVEQKSTCIAGMVGSRRFAIVRGTNSLT